jgi:hypothetical protein
VSQGPRKQQWIIVRGPAGPADVTVTGASTHAHVAKQQNITPGPEPADTKGRIWTDHDPVTQDTYLLYIN